MADKETLAALLTIAVYCARAKDKEASPEDAKQVVKDYHDVLRELEAHLP
jgi:hypothetical protein